MGTIAAVTGKELGFCKNCFDVGCVSVSLIIGLCFGNPLLGVGLGMTGYQLVWPLFGAANQLLAALGLLAVCAWLGNAGRNNKMFYVPMAFMMVVTLTSLALTVWAKIGLLAAGTVDAATVLQLVIGVLLMVFAVILAVKGCKTIFGKKRVA